MRQYFSVRSTEKGVSAFLEIIAELTIVVDLAVQNNGDGFVFIEGGLFASDKIDDREAAHSEGGAIGDKQPFRVRATVYHALTHGVKEFSIARTRWKV